VLIFVCDSVFLCSVPFISNAKIFVPRHNQEQKHAGHKEKSAQVGRFKWKHINKERILQVTKPTRIVLIDSIMLCQTYTSVDMYR
jgi:hypothetical protein